MQKNVRYLMALVVAGAVALGSVALVPVRSDAAERFATVDAVSCPSLLLKHWKASTRQEKLSFLFGFVSMLEMEKEWQGTPPLSITSSITPSWVRGLDGKTLGELCDAVDRYVEQHPDKLDYSVLGVLGRLYVAPKLTPAEKEQARLRHRQIQSRK